jgi:hypothetical protein
MTHQGAAACRREQQGLPEAKPGRVGWVHSTKLTFMTSYKDAFIKATELGKVQAGRFYDDVTDTYLKKYGYKMTYGDDLRKDH